MCFMLYGYRLVVGWFTHVDRFTGFSGCLSLAQKDFRFSRFADDLYSGKVLSWHGFLTPCPDPNIKVGSAFGAQVNIRLKHRMLVSVNQPALKFPDICNKKTSSIYVWGSLGTHIFKIEYFYREHKSRSVQASLDHGRVHFHSPLSFMDHHASLRISQCLCSSSAILLNMSFPGPSGA
jgi:hypothetical protein